MDSVLNFFCDFEERHNNINNRKEIQRWWQFIIPRAYNCKHVCVKNAQLGELSFSNRFIVYLWTGENDAKTLRVDANLFENGEKKLRFQTNTDTCGPGLN